MNSVVLVTIIPSCQPIRGQSSDTCDQSEAWAGEHWVSHLSDQVWSLDKTLHWPSHVITAHISFSSPSSSHQTFIHHSSSLSWLWHQVSRILVFSKVEKVNSLQQLCSSLPSINSMGPIQCWDLWFFLFIFHQIYLSPLPSPNTNTPPISGSEPNEV